VIRPHVRVTPLLAVSGSDLGLAAFPLALKLELFQHAGSFKTRGAFANLLLRQVPPAGVVAASGGNHGAAVAYAAMRLGVPAKIFVPTVSSPAKIRRIREYGADLVVGGERYADALAASEAWVARTGALRVHAFDQHETLLGQGTLGREIEAQAPDLDTLLVAVGGGGLIGGIAAWYGGRIRVIGVEPEAAPTLHHALQAGEPVDAPAGGIAADSLAPRRVGTLMFPIARRAIAQVVLVGEEVLDPRARRCGCGAGGGRARRGGDAGRAAERRTRPRRASVSASSSAAAIRRRSTQRHCQWMRTLTFGYSGILPSTSTMRQPSADSSTRLLLLMAMNFPQLFGTLTSYLGTGGA
jgi:threonine dehydratase